MSFDIDSLKSWTPADPVSYEELNRISNNIISEYNDEMSIRVHATQIYSGTPPADSTYSRPGPAYPITETGSYFMFFSIVATLSPFTRIVGKRMNAGIFIKEFSFPSVGQSFDPYIHFTATASVFSSGTYVPPRSGELDLNTYIVTGEDDWAEILPVPLYGAEYYNNTAADVKVCLKAWVDLRSLGGYNLSTLYAMTCVDAYFKIESI